jgi:hypothetical protein
VVVGGQCRNRSRSRASLAQGGGRTGDGHSRAGS